MIKRFLYVFVACVLMVTYCVTAFAVDDPNLKDPYVPIMPEFLNGANVNIPLDKLSGAAKLFFKDFYKQPYIIAVRQSTATKYYPSSGTSNAQYVGDDKLWFLDFIKVSNYSGVGADIHFRFHHKNDYRVYPASCPIGLVFTDTKITNPAYLEILSYQYDFKNKVFKAPVYQTHSSSQGLQYSYVLASSPVTQFPIPQYPQYGKLGNIPVTYSYDVNYPNVHYNWWLGNADITNDVKPDEPSKPDEPNKPPYIPPFKPPVKPSLPDYDDIKPDKPSAPFTPDSNTNDGYKKPVDGDKPYNPLPPNWQPPTMPKDAFGKPSIKDGSNPFGEPNIKDGGNPFGIPNIKDGGNPFGTPNIKDGGNPFGVPNIKDGGNPFGTPNIKDGGNPFGAPNIKKGVNPFGKPDIQYGGSPYGKPDIQYGGNGLYQTLLDMFDFK